MIGPRAFNTRSLFSLKQMRPKRTKRTAAVTRLPFLSTGMGKTTSRLSSTGEGSNAFTNRLAQETSPYLLQHAFNPVDWYPWGNEAFNKAKAEMKPIFLSIGYSTCHWCHVMEGESFEDEETANLINSNFVAVKVDREERPDVDRVYMSYVQATSGQGGWPMTVFLTPELKPFFGGTYFPKAERYGMPSFKSLLTSIASTWTENRKEILEQSDATLEELTKYLVKRNVPDKESETGKIVDAFIGGCAQSLMKSFDRVHGGFGNAPKFPRPPELHVLLANFLRLRDTDDGKADEILDMVKWTLQKMANGGIYDHVGGGFHRYSVDELWHVPHFEKMLYDNPQIAIAYLHMFQLTADQGWASVACGILDYLKREMTDPLGGIYSAEVILMFSFLSVDLSRSFKDADSMDADKGEKAEGAFYVWTASELKSILDDNEYEAFAACYNIRPNGNCNMSVRSDPHGEFTGKNCLFVSEDSSDAAASLGIDPSDLNALLASCRQKVYQKRKSRPKPHLDNKIVTAWNGMAVSAFAQASRILSTYSPQCGFPIEGHPPSTYLHDARKVAEFIVEHVWDEENSVLKRSSCGGAASVDGFADDYAWTVAGFLDLYETSGELRWLQWALKLQDRMDEIFFDAESGGYFSTTGNDPSILLQLKEEYDSAEPAATSVALSNLVRLSALLSSRGIAFMDKATLTIQSFGARLEEMPHAMPQLAFSMYLHENYATMKKVVIYGSLGDGRSSALLDATHKAYIPAKAVIFVDPSDKESLQFWKINSAENMCVLNNVVNWGEGDRTPTLVQLNTEPTAYVCANFTCKAPTQDPEILEKQLIGGGSTRESFDISILNQKKT